ncbi:hypothetical protein [Methylobacterium oryzihabitans]|nr:hypothetical protein [Methylobacterium oryzihabitans]
MSGDRKRGNREVKKPKQKAPKTIAAAPSTKGLATEKAGTKR